MTIIPLKVKDAKGVTHEVQKYILDPDGRIHIWCNSWYGHHIIGQDCEWPDSPSPVGRSVQELAKAYASNSPTSNMTIFDREHAAFIAGTSVSLPSPIPVSIVEQLEKANPYGESTSNRSMGKSLGWEECTSKLRELIAAQPEIEYKITPDILEKMKEKADVWNDEIKPHILRGIGIGFLMAINHFKLNTAPQPAAVPDVSVLTDALEKVSKYGSSNSDAIEDWAEMRTIASVALSQFNTSKQSGTGNYISLSAAVNEFLSTIPLDNGNNYLPGFGIALDRVRQALPASKQHKEDKV